MSTHAKGGNSTTNFPAIHGKSLDENVRAGYDCS